jgi:hypothetical protein
MTTYLSVLEQTARELENIGDIRTQPPHQVEKVLTAMGNALHKILTTELERIHEDVDKHDSLSTIEELQKLDSTISGCVSFMHDFLLLPHLYGGAIKEMMIIEQSEFFRLKGLVGVISERSKFSDTDSWGAATEARKIFDGIEERDYFIRRSKESR